MAMDSVLAREEFVRHIFAIEQGFERMLDDALNSFSDYASSITKSGTDPKIEQLPRMLSSTTIDPLTSRSRGG